MTIADQTATQNRFVEQFGPPKDTTAAKIKPYMTEQVQEFIGNSPFAVMATCDAKGRCDASPKGGTPGFVKIVDQNHLLFPDLSGNNLFQSYQNADSNPQIGLIFFIPGVNDTVRVNGKVTIVGKEELDRHQVELSAYDHDEKTRNIQAMLIEVTEAYTHCPRPSKFSRVWNVETIAANQAKRPISEKIVGG